MKGYTVKLEQLRVIAWAVVQDGEDGGTHLEPVSLPIDPRKQGEVCGQVEVTGLFNQKIKPHTLKNVIPANGTSLMVLVLCNDKGHELYRRPGSEERIEWVLGFYTEGTDHMDAFEEWRKEAEANPMNYFSWYFDDATLALWTEDDELDAKKLLSGGIDNVRRNVEWLRTIQAKQMLGEELHRATLARGEDVLEQLEFTR